MIPMTLDYANTSRQLSTAQQRELDTRLGELAAGAHALRARLSRRGRIAARALGHDSSTAD